ncbi:MAG: HAD family hydrolase [Firmicutes bacterium]|nr:HAD family hydrolase [Bacillota bacterium]
MGYQYLLFDLDGTLTDPVLGITNSVMHALKKYGIEVNDRSQLYKFIGPPLTDSFENFYGFSKAEAVNAVEYYREYYREKGIFENQVYDGIEELLEKLTDHGKMLLVATSKPKVFAEQILEHFKIAKYFTTIVGSNLDGTKVKKGEVIKDALENCKCIDLAKAVMIGDREYDIIGAKETGIDSIGVLFGYGNRDELEKAGADKIVESVAELGRVLLCAETANKHL